MTPHHFNKAQELTIPQALMLAVKYYQSGDMSQAEIISTQIIQISPYHPDALHLLGVIALQTGNGNSALEFISKAIHIHPTTQMYCNMGNAFQLQGNLDAAIEWNQKALSIEPSYAVAHYSIGNILKDQGKLDAAVGCFQKTLSLDSKYIEAHNNLGLVFYLQGKLDKATECYQQAIALSPNHAKAHNNLGAVFKEQGKLDAASECFQKAISLEPNYFEAHNNFGTVLSDQGKLDAAIESYQKAIALNPNYIEAHNNLGNLFYLQGKPDAAIESFQKAITINPNHAWANLNESLCKLLLGDFENGWQKYEWRWQSALKENQKNNFTQPLWLGDQSVAGKTVLLQAEQGLGDTLQFCRYATLVAALGATVIIEVPYELKALLTSLQGVSKLVEQGEILRPTFDFHVPLMTLPLAFKTRLDTIPDNVPYLHPDPIDVSKWKKRLFEKSKGLRVGLVWAGGHRPDQPNANVLDKRRSLPLKAFEPFGAIEGVQFFSLQKGVPSEQLAQMQKEGWAGPNLIDYTSELRTFADTAALVENLDLVITCDTSIAHLVGAIGKPVWILSRFDGCWRWLLGRDDSPWYPTARLFRQTKFGEWDSVIERVVIALAEMRATATLKGTH